MCVCVPGLAISLPPCLNLLQKIYMHVLKNSQNLRYPPSLSTTSH